MTGKKGIFNIAKEEKVSTKQKENVEIVDTFHLVPFDTNAEKLSPNYEGTDISCLYSLLAWKAPLEKDEFETTVEYKKRIAEAVVPGDIYAFKIEEGSGLSVSPYDADTQKFKISLKTDRLSEYTFEDNRDSLIVKTIDEGSHSYIGSNAFGATREVTSFSKTQYGLAFVYSSSEYSKSIRKVSVAIQIPVDKAKTLKGNIGVLLLCKPALYKSGGYDLIFGNHDYLQATINSPTSITYNRKYINVEILAIWIYDISTGEVISKTQLKGNEIGPGEHK